MFLFATAIESQSRQPILTSNLNLPNSSSYSSTTHTPDKVPFQGQSCPPCQVCLPNSSSSSSTTHTLLILLIHHAQTYTLPLPHVMGPASVCCRHTHTLPNTHQHHHNIAVRSFFRLYGKNLGFIKHFSSVSLLLRTSAILF